jgi:hypothetical protein
MSTVKNPLGQDPLVVSYEAAQEVSPPPAETTAGQSEWARARMPPVAKKKWYHLVSFAYKSTRVVSVPGTLQLRQPVSAQSARCTLEQASHR